MDDLKFFWIVFNKEKKKGNCDQDFFQILKLNDNFVERNIQFVLDKVKSQILKKLKILSKNWTEFSSIFIDLDQFFPIFWFFFSPRKWYFFIRIMMKIEKIDRVDPRNFEQFLNIFQNHPIDHQQVQTQKCRFLTFFCPRVWQIMMLNYEIFRRFFWQFEQNQFSKEQKFKIRD